MSVSPKKVNTFAEPLMQRPWGGGPGCVPSIPLKPPLLKGKESYWCFFSVLVFLLPSPWTFFCRGPWLSLPRIGVTLQNNTLKATHAESSLYQSKKSSVSASLLYLQNTNCFGALHVVVRVESLPRCRVWWFPTNTVW